MTRFVSAITAVAVVSFSTACLADVAPPALTGFQASSGGTTISVQALTPSIVRVRLWRGAAAPEDASWAVPATVRHESVPVRPAPDGFSTGALVVHVDRATLALTVTDAQGRTIVADEP